MEIPFPFVWIPFESHPSSRQTVFEYAMEVELSGHVAPHPVFVVSISLRSLKSSALAVGLEVHSRRRTCGSCRPSLIRRWTAEQTGLLHSS